VDKLTYRIRLPQAGGETTGRLSLYYDIELREPIDTARTSGGLFRTTTLITKKRIFIPVPEALVNEFEVISVPREFFVRFDVLVSASAD
jgi:molecular chaperone HtpG